MHGDAGEPVLTTNPGRHALVVAGSVLFGAALAYGFGFLLSGESRVGGLAAVVTGVAWLPALLPVLTGGRTVPSRFGNAVLFGTMGHTLATLGLGLLVVMSLDVPRRPFMSGVLAGAFVVLVAQVAMAVWTLRGASASGGVDESLSEGRG